MRILFLSHYFPPEVNAPASRTFEHCRVWVEEGHEVTVVTCAPNHPRGAVYEGYQNRFFHRERIDGMDVIRIWTYLSANEGFAKRTLNYVSFMVMCILLAWRMPKADVLLTTSPQFFNGLAGYFVSRMKRLPWVLEIRDLWPDSILAVGAIKNRSVIKVLKYLERFAYRKSTHIVPVTDAFRKHIESLGIPAGKITVIKNGADLARYDDSISDDGLRVSLGLEGKTIAAYFGTHGMAHHLETILEAADLLRDNSNIMFLMIGDGAEREALLKLKKEMDLSNVMILGQQPKEKMPNYWALSDIALVLLRKSELFKTVIPSKIFEAMAMRKPIILGVEGESREIIEQADSGVAIPPEDARALCNAVLHLSDDKLSELKGANGKRFVAEHFDRRKLAERYLTALSNTISASD